MQKSSLGLAKKQGMEEGFEQGLEQGVEQERLKNNKEKQAMIEKMHQAGLDIDTISQVTTLTVEEVNIILTSNA